MKLFKILALVSIITTATIPVFSQDSKKDTREKEKEEQYQALLLLINNQQYEFRANRANPQRGPQVDLTTRENFLRINKEHAAADMPYFGRAFSAGYSASDGGVQFEGPMETYEVIKNDKKRRLTIKFKIKGPDDTYTCTLNVSAPNSAILSVISTRRQTISYSGVVSGIIGEAAR